MKQKYPGTLLEFERWFRTEEDCRRYLIQIRWPDGFQCTACGHRQAWVRGIGSFRCGKCRRDRSVTAGTVFQDSHIPLRLWFRAMWWLTNQKGGVSALGLQRLLGLGSYKTAWSCLQKLRRAMVRPGRDPLSGRVEVDEVYVGGISRDNSSRRSKACILVAAEARGKAIGRIRLERIADDNETNIVRAVRRCVAPGSTLITDGAWAYRALVPHGYGHDRNIQGERKRRDLDQMQPLPRAHRIASLLKRWLLGTHRGRVIGSKLDPYLDEFAYRFNRRGFEQRGLLFHRLVHQCVTVTPTPYASITGRLKQGPGS